MITVLTIRLPGADMDWRQRLSADNEAKAKIV